MEADQLLCESAITIYLNLCLKLRYAVNVRIMETHDLRSRTRSSNYVWWEPHYDICDSIWRLRQRSIWNKALGGPLALQMLICVIYRDWDPSLRSRFTWTKTWNGPQNTRGQYFAKRRHEALYLEMMIRIVVAFRSIWLTIKTVHLLSHD